MRQETGILHYKVSATTTVDDFLSAEGYSHDQIVLFLFRGCIYVDGLRTRQKIALKPEQIIRLHTKPKSYSWSSGPLRNRIIFDDPEFLVLDKPAGLPTHATLDNYVDNAKFLLEQELEIPIYSTHRLDIPTQGLLIFAKTPAAQKVINKTFAEGRVEKIYRAITQTPVPLGEHVLYINPETRVPRAHSFTEVPGWWKCRMEILDSEPSTLTIRLITGKTHQIRAQLAALGAPIVGDTTYGSTKKYVPERLALECSSLSFTFRSRTISLTRPHGLKTSDFA